MKTTLQHAAFAAHYQSRSAEDAAQASRAAIPATGLRRWLYLVLGGLFVGLAALGAMLPILPTTPFLLLASWFFMRSNPALRDRLLRLPAFGSLLHDWERHRAVRPQTKQTVYVLVPCVITASVVGGELSWPLTVLLGSLGVIGVGVVWRLRVIPCLERERGVIAAMNDHTVHAR